MNYIIGYIIIAAMVFSTVVAFIVAYFAFHRALETRVSASYVWGGAFGARTMTLAANACAEALVVIEQVAITHGFLQAARRSTVEIVRPGEVRSTSVTSGKMPDGRDIGGSITTKCMFGFFGPRRYVIHVAIDPTDERRTGATVIHEWAQHVLSVYEGKGPNAAHDRMLFTLIETTCKQRYERG